ncbi:MAG: FtsB family cell division protein [Streptosporangiaceae bacterium]
MPEAAGDRPRFTSRAAVLIVVICAIALSLAYPVREYISQLHQIDQLRTQRTAIAARVRQLKAERTDLSSPAYVEQQARDRLQMCFPAQTCYVITDGTQPAAPARSRRPAARPWYEKLWSSVGQAGKASAP